MVKRKAGTNRSTKTAKKSTAATKRHADYRRSSKKNESRDGAPAGVTQGDSLILDGTSLDSVVQEEPYVGRPRIEIFFDCNKKMIVGMRTTRREVADEL